ncbi:MAG: hypothetical protein AAB509_00825 [Patescibacteria group bacterium]
MDKKFLIVLHIVSGLFILILGGGLGILYQSQKDSLPSANPKTQAVQTLSSKVIPAITAFGQVAKIDGKNVTLTFGGDSLTVKIIDNATVFLPAISTTDKNGKPVTTQQQIANFTDIKVGDSVSINLKLLPDGQIEGQMVIIIGVQK